MKRPRSNAMGRCFVVSHLVVAAALLTVPIGGAADVQSSAQYVRNSVPAIEAYAAGHGGYRGMTLAKIRRWDRSLRNISIRSATKRSYCVESTTRPFAHKSGPAAPVSTGRCGARGTPVPYAGQGADHSPPGMLRIRAAVPVIEAYAADHHGYVGMTLLALRKYEPSLAGITIVRALQAIYCVESGAGADHFHKNGPRADVLPGPCPAAG